jgi:hypothetical protein
MRKPEAVLGYTASFAKQKWCCALLNHERNQQRHFPSLDPQGADREGSNRRQRQAPHRAVGSWTLRRTHHLPHRNGPLLS